MQADREDTTTVLCFAALHYNCGIEPLGITSPHHNHHCYDTRQGGQVDSMFDSCLKDTGSNPAEAGRGITTVSKLFTPTVPSGAEGQLNQLTSGISSTSGVTPG